MMLSLPSKYRPKVVALTVRQTKFAIDAISRYGKGKNGLNYGDCMTYGLAKDRGLPLLFKGDDFAVTDLSLIQAVV